MRRRGLIIGIVAVVICLITGLSALLTSGGTSFIASGVNGLMRPVETGIRRMVSTLERTYDYMYQYDVLEQNYEALLDQVAEYEQMVRDAEEASEENERLRELLELKSRANDWDVEDATVIGRTANNWSSSFTIDKGSDFNVSVGDPVMTERGELVGEVIEVGGTWATVRTIIDTDTSVGALLGSGVSAMAVGSFSLMGEGLLRLSYVPSGEIPLMGDTVTTSGLGERIPKGLTIGTIVEVDMEDTGSSYYAVIEPAADLDSLSQVFVVREFLLKE